MPYTHVLRALRKKRMLLRSNRVAGFISPMTGWLIVPADCKLSSVAKLNRFLSLHRSWQGDTALPISAANAGERRRTKAPEPFPFGFRKTVCWFDSRRWKAATELSVLAADPMRSQLHEVDRSRLAVDSRDWLATDSDREAVASTYGGASVSTDGTLSGSASRNRA